MLNGRLTGVAGNSVELQVWNNSFHGAGMNQYCGCCSVLGAKLSSDSNADCALTVYWVRIGAQMATLIFAHVFIYI